MSAHKSTKDRQPLLYIDNPVHQPVSKKKTEVAVLYKRNGSPPPPREKSAEPDEEHTPQNDTRKEEEDSPRESVGFSLSRHLGYDWQMEEMPIHREHGRRAHEQLQRTIREEQNQTKRERKKRNQKSEKTQNPRQKDQKEKLDNSEDIEINTSEDESTEQIEANHSFEDKSIAEKVDFLFRMRNRTPLTCSCKTADDIWVGTVDAVNEKNFSMQVHKAPYYVTINYEDVLELNLEHFS